MYNIYANVQKHLQSGSGIAIRTTGSGRDGKMEAGFSKTLIPLDPDDLQLRFYEKDGCFSLLEPVTPSERLIVLGGGHVSASLCEFAASCGFSITVIDDRPAFANTVRFPMAKQVICKDFTSAIQELHLTAYDYVVIVTRGHRHDGDCLRALYPQTKPAYLGMIGSRRRVSGLKDVLEEEGIARDWLDAVCSPIGLNIGAITPAEIGISILAEIIQYKRMPASASHPVYHSDLEPEIINHLAENTDPKAIITVVSSMGSTPRGAGAKMSVNQAGQITGTIGGGCAEGSVIQTAIRMIGTGSYKLVDIDMSGDVAESEGMVCGGIMTVLIEDGRKL